MDHRLFGRLFAVVGSAAMALAGSSCASPNRGTDGVGPPIVITSPVGKGRAAADAHTGTGLVVVTWNVHEGRGNIADLMASFRPAPVVLLLQEATRRTLPASVTPLGLHAAYVPSMPNGPRGEQDDRGCAIVSTLPIDDVASIELPWVYQRRVAVTGTIAAPIGGKPHRLRFVCVHLDNRPGRKRQAEWLARWLQPFAADGAPLVVGADLNTWFGVKENTVRAIDDVVPRVAVCGVGPTFRFGLRLDHLFTTLPASVRRGCAVSPDTFRSDHHPVVMRVELARGQ